MAINTFAASPMIRTANLIGSISRKAGGLHESVRRLVQSLEVAEVGVQVLTVEDEFTQRDLPVWNPVKVDVFHRTWPPAFGYSAGFLRALNEQGPDLTHTHGIWMYPSIATAAYCIRRRLPYMISPHGMIDPWAVRHHRWKKVFAYALYESNHVRGARCIRALCESEARSVRQLKFKNPVVVIPNGIDLPEMTNGRSNPVDAPWADFIEPGQKVMLFLSRIHPKKGLANLLKAWAQGRHSPRATRHAQEWVLAIAGWDQGRHEEDLKRLANELGISWRDLREHRTSNEASLLFLGPQFGDDKAACYANCDAFILPSFSEGLPMVILEAWAYGKPVLMTPECNLPEGFAAQAALRIDTTTEGIAEGLRTLYSASDLELAHIGDRGRQLVQQRFTWETIAAQVKATYGWMLGGGTRPDCMFQG